MKRFVGWLSLGCFLVNIAWANDDTALNERAPFKMVTKERAEAAVQEAERYLTDTSPQLSSSTDAKALSMLKESQSLQMQAKQALADQSYGTALRLSNNAIKRFLDAREQANPYQPAIIERKIVDQSALNQRAPLKQITKERAHIAIQEMNQYFNSAQAAEIKEIHDEEVQSSWQEGLNLQKDAEQAFADASYASAIRLSNNAIKAFLDTRKKTIPHQSAEQQQQYAYQEHLKKVQTFMAALRQAASDVNHDHQEIIASLQNQINFAEELASKKQFLEGHAVLDEVVIGLKADIRNLLHGEQLHAEKDESPQGIYQYELFRNDTYRALIDLLRHSEAGQVFSQEDYFKHNEKLGDELHEEAMVLAEQTQFEQASQKMAESTSAYKYAVRRAGILIPD